MAFDEAAYLAANPDVAAAVQAGAFGGDAYQHFLQYGQAEGRSPLGATGLFQNKPEEIYQQKPGTNTAAQPNWSSGAGYATNITAPAGTGAYYQQLNDAMAAYRAGVGVNPITGKTKAEEGDSWLSQNNYMMQPDIAMNYMVNAAGKGVTPEQFALAHADMSIASGDTGRGGVLPTGQNVFERVLGKEGGTFYNIFGQGDRYAGNNPALLDPRQGITMSPESAARYKQVFGSSMGNVGPFTGLDPSARQALNAQLTASFNRLSGGGGTTPSPATPRPPVGGSGGFTSPNPTYNTPPLNQPASGMTQIQTGDDYMKSLNDYYKSYFGGGSPDNGLLSTWYSGQYSPTPSAGYSSANPGGSSARGIVNSLPWNSADNTRASTLKLHQYMTQYGLGVQDVASAMGMTEPEVIAHFAKYGITLTPSNRPTAPVSSGNDRPNDGG